MSDNPETKAEAEEAATAPETTIPLTEEEQDRLNAALDSNDVIKNHVIAAMAVGLVPLPAVDLAGTLAVQVRMVNQLCEIYDVKLRENAIKATILSLAGGIVPVTLAGGLVSGLKIIPGLGTLAGAAGSSLLGGAMTYAIGRVFQQHLESHDSLIDLDVTRAREAMRREFDAGLGVARSLRGKVTNAIIAKEKARKDEPEVAATAAPEAPAGTEPAAA